MDNYNCHVVDGMLVPSFVKQEYIDKLKKTELYDDDTWVVAYPKCGSTWMQQIVKLILNKGEPNDVPLNVAVPYVEGGEGLEMQMARPRAFRSHFPYHKFPCGLPSTTPCKYIYVARNPKDVAVSYYYFLIKRPDYKTLIWDTFWKRYTGGGHSYGSFFDHVLGWWSHRDDDNVLFMKYEDMKKDLVHAVSLVAQHIGADLPPELILKIANLSSFDKMKVDPSTNWSWSEEFVNPSGSGPPTFMRKGTVGDWKNHLTPEESSQIDLLCAERLTGTGLEFDFELA